MLHWATISEIKNIHVINQLINYCILYYYYTYKVQISINAINKMPELVQNLAAIACTV